MKATNANAKPSNVVSINPKGDKAQPNEAYKAERIKVLDNIDTAEDLLGTALLEGLRMTVLYGATSKDEVAEHYTRCGSPEVYASWFNRGDKAQAVIGRKLALEVIDKAAATKNGGAAFVKARDALKAVIDTAKSSGSKQLANKPAATAVKAALALVSAPRVKASRPVKSQDSATMAAAALECGKGHREMAGFIKLASQQAHRLPAPAGREEAHRKALTALAEASEAWQVFAK